MEGLFWLEGDELVPYSDYVVDAPENYRNMSEDAYRRAFKAKDVMSSPVRTIEHSATLELALDTMKRYHIAHLGVLKEGQFCGLLSDRDCLYAESPHFPVEAVMSQHLLLASPEERLPRIAAIMVEHRVNCVPILDPQYFLVGILTTTDILGCMTYQAPLDFWC